jgi:hypothetical protein
MIVEQFADALRSRGLKLRVDNSNRLHVGPPELLTDRDDLEAIKEMKDGIIAALFFEGRS